MGPDPTEPNPQIVSEHFAVLDPVSGLQLTFWQKNQELSCPNPSAGQPYKKG